MPTAPPETTVHPAGAPRGNTVVAEPVMTEFQALRQLGFFSPFDVVMAVIIGLSWLTFIYWKIFGEPSFTDALACCLINFIAMQAWAISLLYRCMHFVVHLRARVEQLMESLPQEAARIVMSAYSGGQRR